MLNKEAQQTVERIVEGLKKELGGTKPAIDAINSRMDVLEQGLEKAGQSRDELVRALDDLTSRLNRQIKLSELGLVQTGGGRMGHALPEEFTKLFYRVAKGKQLGPLTEVEMRELSSGTSADGGYLIKPEILPIFQQVLLQYGAFRRNATVIPVGSNEATFPKLGSSVVVYWIAENAPGIESFPTFGEVTLNVKKLMGLSHVSMELLDDANPDLAQLMTQLFLRAIAYEEDHQGFLGTGAGADPFIGLFLDPSVSALVMSAGNTTFSDVTSLDLLRMQSQIPAQFLPNAKYFFNRTVWAKIREETMTTGQYVWQPATQGEPALIWGYPYEVVEILPSLSATAISTPFVGFGDASIAAALADRRQVTIDRSDAPGFTKAQTHIRLIERVGPKVMNGAAFTVLETAAA